MQSKFTGDFILGYLAMMHLESEKTNNSYLPCRETSKVLPSWVTILFGTTKNCDYFLFPFLPGYSVTLWLKLHLSASASRSVWIIGVSHPPTHCYEFCLSVHRQVVPWGGQSIPWVLVFTRGLFCCSSLLCTAVWLKGELPGFRLHFSMHQRGFT